VLVTFRTGLWLLPTLACFASLVLVGWVQTYTRLAGMLVEPGGRSSHQRATATGGGAGLVAAVLLASLWPSWSGDLPSAWWLAVLPGVLLLAVVGWADDRRSLPRRMRLVVQFAVSLWLLGCAWSSTAPGGTLPNSASDWAIALAVVVALVWIMNAYNFMDGSNGMAGGEGVFAGLALGALALLGRDASMALASFIVAGACLGFLPWNFPRARIFMGDAGSVPLGFALGALLLLAVLRGGVAAPVAVLVPGVFLTDATLTLLLRIFRGEQWYNPHNQHVYQRLIARGWSHRNVLVLYQAINITIVLPGIALGKMYSDKAWLVTGLAYLALLTGWCAANLKWGWILERRTND